MALLELWWETRCFSRVGMGILAKSRSFRKGVQYCFVFQVGTWDNSRDTGLEISLILR